MVDLSLEGQITTLLANTNSEGGYAASCVCTADGLVVAADGAEADDTAAVVSLFDDVLLRARRDLRFGAVDEVALLDPGRARLVIRPLDLGDSLMFLVVWVPPKRTWRRYTNALCRKLTPLLRPLTVVA